MSEAKILISSRSFGKIQSGAIKRLEDHGFIPVMNPTGKKLQEEEILQLIDDDVVGIIAGTEQITEKILEKSSKLQVVSRYGVGMDNVDVSAARKHDITVVNTPDAPALAVAELTMGFMFCLLKRMGLCDRRLRKKEWNGEVGNLLTGKTVGIIGLGRIGKKLVTMLEPFQVDMLVCEPCPDESFIKTYNIRIVELDDLLESSDIITLHIPLTDETEYIIGKQELSQMKKEAILINTARGGLVNEKELYNALKENIISGAGVDVFEHEPDTNNLETLDNVIVTPHIATLTKETRKQMEIEAVDNVINNVRWKQ